jgi:cobalt-zinc-cadmium efflux system membrane fusion protein
MNLRYVIPLLILAACTGTEQNEDKETGAQTAANTVHFNKAQIEHGGVRWEPTAASATTATFELPGQLVPNDDQTARIGSPSEARIMRVFPHVGDRVSAGEALVVLQSPTAGTARSDVSKATAEVNSRRAALTYARTTRERAERLLESKAGSRQDLERARADEELAQSTLTQAEAELRRAQAASRQLGVNASGEMVVRSPLAGVVLSREAVQGAVAQPGAPLVTVSNVKSLWLEVAAAEHAASALRNGQRVRFSVPAFPGETFEASVASIGGSLDSQTRTLPVRATVDNSSGKLRPAMFATVQLTAGAETTAASVLEGAVILIDEKPTVFVARTSSDGGADFERRAVEIGSKANGRALIVRGVSPGENVVVAGAFAIKSQFERSKLPAE